MVYCSYVSEQYLSIGVYHEQFHYIAIVFIVGVLYTFPYTHSIIERMVHVLLQRAIINIYTNNYTTEQYSTAAIQWSILISPLTLPLYIQRVLYCTSLCAHSVYVYECILYSSTVLYHSTVCSLICSQLLYSSHSYRCMYCSLCIERMILMRP